MNESGPQHVFPALPLSLEIACLHSNCWLTKLFNCGLAQIGGQHVYVRTWHKSRPEQMLRHPMFLERKAQNHRIFLFPNA